MEKGGKSINFNVLLVLKGRYQNVYLLIMIGGNYEKMENE